MMPANSIADRQNRRRRKPHACRLVRREQIAVNQRPKSCRKDKFTGGELQRFTSYSLPAFLAHSEMGRSN
jgi:hypothetical protein